MYESKEVNEKIKEIRRKLIQIHNENISEKIDEDGSFVLDLCKYGYTNNQKAKDKMKPFIKITFIFEGVVSENATIEKLKEIETQIEKV